MLQSNKVQQIAQICSSYLLSQKYITDQVITLLGSISRHQEV